MKEKIMVMILKSVLTRDLIAKLYSSIDQVLREAVERTDTEIDDTIYNAVSPLIKSALGVNE